MNRRAAVGWSWGRGRIPKRFLLWCRSTAGNYGPRGWQDAVRRYAGPLAMLLCGLAAAALLRHAFVHALGNSHDNDWGPAHALLHGLDPYKLYLSCLACTKPVFVPAVAPMYPASGLILLWPFAVLPWPVARAAWAVLNLLFGAGLVLLLHRLFPAEGPWRSLALAFIALFAGAPFLTNLAIGQHAVFALGWFVVALWADRRGNAALAAASLAAAWFKYTLTFPLSLIFLVRGRWALLLGALAIHVGLTGFAAVWTGSSPLDLLLGPLRVVHAVHRAGHLDVFGLAMRLGLTPKLLPIAAASALTLAVLLAARRSRPRDDLALLCLLSLFAYAVVYHLAYDLVVLVIPLFYVLHRMPAWRELQGLERAWWVMLAVLLTYFDLSLVGNPTTFVAGTLLYRILGSVPTIVVGLLAAATWKLHKPQTSST